jgi:hypothetical protein
MREDKQWYTGVFVDPGFEALIEQLSFREEVEDVLSRVEAIKLKDSLTPSYCPSPQPSFQPTRQPNGHSSNIAADSKGNDSIQLPT